MKKFVLMHCGFEPPTPEVMQGWGKWFQSIADQTVENGGFHGAAKEIAKDGSRDLPMDMDAITGYTIVKAKSIDEAEAIARANPIIKSIRVYEIVEH